MHKQLNNVLLIDDNDDDNFFHELILREAGLTKQIHISETAPGALQFLEATPVVPELIFLDINMPGMNGWEFLEKYRKLAIEKKSTVIIIMLTTSLNPADRKRADAIPEVNGFESKPLTQEMVEKIIEKFFANTKE
jgi:CheY-like chemotaxis protein